MRITLKISCISDGMVTPGDGQLMYTVEEIYNIIEKRKIRFQIKMNPAPCLTNLPDVKVIGQMQF